MRLEYRQIYLPLARPLETSYGTLRKRSLVVVELMSEDGLTGLGEAAPLEPYDGISVQTVLKALERYRIALDSAFGDEPAADLIERCRAEIELPQALAAVDIALWDIAGKRANRPVAALLSDKPLETVEVNATVGAEDLDRVGTLAAEAVRSGFSCIKLKVGTVQDLERLIAVRAAVGPKTTIRVDANGAWSPEEAVERIAAFEPFGIELVEEPTHGLAGLRHVQQNCNTPIAMDESATDLESAGSGACSTVCLKIARLGGIGPTLAAAESARAAGSQVYLASTLDGPIGIAAALQAAAAVRPERACGLATLTEFPHLLANTPLLPQSGAISVPTNPGIGISKSDGSQPYLPF